MQEWVGMVSCLDLSSWCTNICVRVIFVKGHVTFGISLLAFLLLFSFLLFDLLPLLLWGSEISYRNSKLYWVFKKKKKGSMTACAAAITVSVSNRWLLCPVLGLNHVQSALCLPSECPHCAAKKPLTLLCYCVRRRARRPIAICATVG